LLDNDVLSETNEIVNLHYSQLNFVTNFCRSATKVYVQAAIMT